MAGTRGLFVVQRCRLQGSAGWSQESRHAFPDEPLQAFSDRDKAEAYRLQLEAEARRQVLPLEFVSSYSPVGTGGVTLDVVLARFGLDLPIGIGFRERLHDLVDRLTPEQRQALWKPFDTFAFYEVVEVELED